MSISVNLNETRRGTAEYSAGDAERVGRVAFSGLESEASSSFVLVSPEKSSSEGFSWWNLFPMLGLFSGMQIDFDDTNVNRLRAEYEQYRLLAVHAKPHEARAYYLFMQFSAGIEIAYEKVKAGLLLGRKPLFDEAAPETYQRGAPLLSIVRETQSTAGNSLPEGLAEVSETLVRQGAAKLLNVYEQFFEAYLKLNFSSKNQPVFNHRLGFLHALIGFEAFVSNLVQDADLFNNVILRVVEGTYYIARSGESADANAALTLFGRYSDFLPKERSDALVKALGGMILANEFDRVMTFVEAELRKKGISVTILRTLIDGEQGNINLILEGFNRRKTKNGAYEDHLKIIDGEVSFYSIALERFIPLKPFTERAPACDVIDAMPVLKPLMPSVMPSRLSPHDSIAFSALQQPTQFMRELEVLREGFKRVRATMERPDRK